MKSRCLRLAALPLVLALVVSACGSDGGDAEDAEADDDQTTSATASPSEEESEAEAGMTDAGTELALGEPADVTWQAKEDLTGRARVVVSRLDQVSIKVFSGYQLDAAKRRSNPYYVQVTVRNTGNTDLSGELPPLYLDNGSDVLFPAAKIDNLHKPCPSTALPKGFTQGKTAKLCLVFLAPDRTTLRAMVLRPNEDFEPITWTGQITKPVAKKPAQKKQ
jgi:hypothetical protein